MVWVARVSLLIRWVVRRQIGTCQDLSGARSLGGHSRDSWASMPFNVRASALKSAASETLSINSGLRTALMDVQLRLSVVSKLSLRAEL